MTLERRNEPEPAPRKRLYESRILRGVTQGQSHLRDDVRQSAIEIDVDVALPERLFQIVAGNDCAGAEQQERQRPGRLGLDRHTDALPAEFEGVEIEVEGAEAREPWLR
jgi:hypothetical protein